MVVENRSTVDRTGEIVEIEIEDADSYVVYNQNDEPIECQTTYEGNLIFPATVAAGTSTEYTLRKGERIEVETIAHGQVYPQWHNNFAWENDKIGYRAYAKDIAHTGAKLYGYDIFTKKATKPVLEILFNTQFDPEYQRLIKEPNSEELIHSISIHTDHGLGMDYYAVGPKMGSGTAALVSDGEIQYPYFFDHSEVLDQGGLRISFKLYFAPVIIGGEEIQEVRTISLDKGAHFNNIEVEYKNLSKPAEVVIGIAMHDMGEVKSIAEGYTAYAEPKHKFGWQTYNAIIYPKEMTSEIDMFDEVEAGSPGQLLAKGTYTPGEKLHYYMGAGWNRWGFETPQEWFDYVAEQNVALREPLTYTLSK